jgi:hypothetical protein
LTVSRRSGGPLLYSKIPFPHNSWNSCEESLPNIMKQFSKFVFLNLVLQYFPRVYKYELFELFRNAGPSCGFWKMQVAIRLATDTSKVGTHLCLHS